MLTRVTITGADDRTPVEALAELTREFPFLELGVLYSTSRIGTSRYPSMAWAYALRQVVSRDRVAVHLCGQVSRDALLGTSMDLAHAYLGAIGGVARVQLNGWDGLLPAAQEKLANFAFVSSRELILQCRTEGQLQQAADDAALIYNGSVLFDPSGGRGIEAFRYPPTPLNCGLGFAGGIGPDNVLEVLKAIGPRDHLFWIDMETRVRTDDVLDLDKVRRVLEACAPYVGKLEVPGG